MAEQRMEAIQSARRKAVDYDPLSSDDEEHAEEIDLSIPETTTTAPTGRTVPRTNVALSSSPPAQKHPSSSFDPLYSNIDDNNNIQNNAASATARTTTHLNSAIHRQSSADLPVGLSTGKSLLDDVDDVSFELTPMFSRIADVAAIDPTPVTTGEAQKFKTAGVAGYLEIEEEPPRIMVESPFSRLPAGDGPINIDGEEPIKTSSGLLLTHRRTPTSSSSKTRQSSYKQYPVHAHGDDNDHDNKKHRSNGPFLRIPQSPGFSGWSSSSPSLAGSSHFFTGYGSSFGGGGGGRHSMAVVQAKRFMSYVRLWVVLSFVLLMVATGVLVHSFHHDNNDTADPAASSGQKLQQQSGQVITSDQVQEAQEQIILVPIENISEWASVQQQKQREQPMMRLGYEVQNRHLDDNSVQFDGPHGGRRVLTELRQEFESWVQDHSKEYHSANEKERRFSIWTHNHQRTIEKNRRHGPCKMTKQHVFGSTPFQDLTHEEFKSTYLTGYKGPRFDDLHEHHNSQGRSPKMQQLANGVGHVLGPHIHKPNVHHSVKKRMLQQKDPVLTYQQPHCSWYDVSCWLRWIWGNTNLSLVGIGTMEPAYDADSYPNAIDWRTLGAVTDVRYQGTCGACWAITAVETVESAHFISTGQLYDLAESEIILCDQSCEMCEGGWPQNAFSWVMSHGGLPLQNDFSYDGDLLYSFTEAMAGTSDAYAEDDVKSYRSQQCPDGDDNSHSGDGEDREFDQDGKTNENYADYSSSGRYGNIKGYGYATDRCVCYSDGSGCNCDNQKEGLAVRNVATYGPAVVCLEASLWQDYTGGIISSELGCSQKFLDMNHCVQVVGYAYTDGSDAEQEAEEEDNSHSGSGDKSGSQDDQERSGYWIVRNQWGQNWGMSGYAYVAMGENTCGILNDMAQAYL